MPRKQYFDQLVSPFSYWNRSLHNGVSYTDLDIPYKFMALKAEIPFFTIWYTVDEDTENREITEFHIQNQLSHGQRRALTPDQMLEYLEWKVQQHIPKCSAKNYLLKRITEDNQHNKNFTRRNNYVEILSNRS